MQIEKTHTLNGGENERCLKAKDVLFEATSMFSD